MKTSWTSAVSSPGAGSSGPPGSRIPVVRCCRCAPESGRVHQHHGHGGRDVAQRDDHLDAADQQEDHGGRRSGQDTDGRMAVPEAADDSGHLPVGSQPHHDLRRAEHIREYRAGMTPQAPLPDRDARMRGRCLRDGLGQRPLRVGGQILDVERCRSEAVAGGYVPDADRVHDAAGRLGLSQRPVQGPPIMANRPVSSGSLAGPTH